MNDPILDSIDWSTHDKYSEDTITCNCGAVFRSHIKLRHVDVTMKIYTRKPCPACGSHNTVTSAKSDPASMAFGN